MQVERWNSKIGVILAVSGSAVGLGNFLKFPGQIALYGGAAFMVAYVFSFILLGLPIAIMEWTIGRHGGAHGFNSPVGCLGYFCRSKKVGYIGLLAVLLTMIVFCYYVYIESWCLGYAVNFLTDNLNFETADDAMNFFASFTGASEDGSGMAFSFKKVLGYLIFAFILNFFIIYKGIAKGIEFFCKYAMPVLGILAVVVVIRVFTLAGVSGDNPMQQGLGFMWNPTKVILQENVAGEWQNDVRLIGDSSIKEASLKVESAPNEYRIQEISLFEQLLNSSLWIAAAGQVFFSLTVGFGCIMTYASYLKRNDDIILNALTSASANEFCEVCLGGLITVPAAISIFGVSGIIGAGLSLFDLGFKVLPIFFLSIPLGQIFGFMFFFLLFLAAVTSSLSMLQPSIAFIEEALKVKRKISVMILSNITFFITSFVLYFSKDLKAMDTFDFWIGQMTVYIFALSQTILFAWYYGGKRGLRLANEGSDIKAPKFFGYVFTYITPVLLILIFIFWLATQIFSIGGDKSPYIVDLFGDENTPVNKVSWFALFIIGISYFVFAMILNKSKSYKRLEVK